MASVLLREGPKGRKTSTPESQASSYIIQEHAQPILNNKLTSSERYWKKIIMQIASLLILIAQKNELHEVHYTTVTCKSMQKLYKCV